MRFQRKEYVKGFLSIMLKSSTHRTSSYGLYIRQQYSRNFEKFNNHRSVLSSTDLKKKVKVIRFVFLFLFFVLLRMKFPP